MRSIIDPVLNVLDDLAYNLRIPKGESPIEDILVMALHRDLGYLYHLDCFEEDQISYLRDLNGLSAKAFIYRQHKILPYRADILVVAIGLEGSVRKLVIECDGYEFHSTRDQKKYDLRRSHVIQLKGYHFVRFSGYRINRDINGVLTEIVETLGEIGNEICRATGRYPRPGHWNANDEILPAEEDSDFQSEALDEAAE